MNTTMILIILAVIMVAAGLILLLIGEQYRRKEAMGEVIEEDKQEQLDRLAILRRYAVQTESQHNLKLMSDEEYEREMAWVDAELDEVEGRNDAGTNTD